MPSNRFQMEIVTQLIQAPVHGDKQAVIKTPSYPAVVNGKPSLQRHVLFHGYDHITFFDHQPYYAISPDSLPTRNLKDMPEVFTDDNRRHRYFDMFHPAPKEAPMVEVYEQKIPTTSLTPPRYNARYPDASALAAYNVRTHSYADYRVGWKYVAVFSVVLSRPFRPDCNGPALRSIAIGMWNTWKRSNMALTATASSQNRKHTRATYSSPPPLERGSQGASPPPRPTTSRRERSPMPYRVSSSRSRAVSLSPSPHSSRGRRSPSPHEQRYSRSRYSRSPTRPSSRTSQPRPISPSNPPAVASRYHRRLGRRTHSPSYSAQRSRSPRRRNRTRPLHAVHHPMWNESSRLPFPREVERNHRDHRHDQHWRKRGRDADQPRHHERRTRLKVEKQQVRCVKRER